MNGPFVIRITGYRFPLYERVRPTTTGATTRRVEEARVYQTRAGAQRWMDARAPFPGVVESVTEAIADCLIYRRDPQWYMAGAV